MTYSAKDLERVEALRERLRVELGGSFPPAFLNADIAQLIADVRREALEEAAEAAESFFTTAAADCELKREIARDIRALKDGAR